MNPQLEKLMALHKANPIVMHKAQQSQPKQDEHAQTPTQIATQDNQQNKTQTPPEPATPNDQKPATSAESSHDDQNTPNDDNAPKDSTPKQAPTVTPANTVSEPVSAEAVDTKPAFTPVNVSILGTPHRIVCPSDGVQQLEEAVSFINGKMRSIRQDMKGKIPTNEELLVLVCLEMHDQIKALQDSEDYYTSERDDALALIDKLLKSAKIV